jgi:hypothetical protein
MATIQEPRFRAMDNTGNVYVGATLTIYTAGTTTPANIYRDSGLTTPMTNPTTGSDKSGADGYFPQVFAAEGTSFDVVIKKADGTTLGSLLSVPAVGSDSGALTRDFGPGGRLRIAGSGGIVRVEGGDPTGDDLGGKITLGGYNGTQADIVTLDGASVNTTGTLTELGKSLPGVVQTGKTAFTAVSSVVIALPNSPAGVATWDVDVFDLVASNSGAIFTLTASTDGGVTYAATGYQHDLVAGNNGSVSDTYTSTAGTAFSLTIGMAQSSKIWSSIRVHAALVRGQTMGITSATTALAQFLLAGMLQGGTAITHLKLIVSAGTMTGFYRVVPLRGFN